MFEESVIFEVTFTYRALIRGGTDFHMNITTSTTVLGAHERDKLITALRGMGFDPEWGYLKAPNAKGALDKLVKGFADWPPATNA